MVCYKIPNRYFRMKHYRKTTFCVGVLILYKLCKPNSKEESSKTNKV